MKVHTKFLLSAVAPEHFPAPELPEVAFLGRSNVGKSSLINSLVGAKVAKTSNTPGRTQAINFFEIRWQGRPKPELVFADLPGYGYAKLSKSEKSTWGKMLEDYLRTRVTLRAVMVLVDLRRGVEDDDEARCG